MHKSLTAIALLLISCLILTAVSGCVKVKNPEETKGPATLSEVVTSTAVSSQGKALSDVTKFIATTPEIYLSARVNTAPEDTLVEARWIYVTNEENKEVNEELYNDSMTVSGTRYISFNHGPPSGTWAKGSYMVAVFLNGKEVIDVPFMVKEVHEADVPYPTIHFFKALPEALNFGQTVLLSWSTSNADKVDVAPAVGTSLPGTGNKIVTPVNSMEYKLTATNSAGTTTKTIKVVVTSFYSDKPELVITDFRVQGTTAYYKIKNIAEIPSRSSKTFLYIQGYNRASGFVDAMAAGQEREETFPNFEWTYGSQRTYKLPVRVCADGLNEIKEYDEDNNCLEMDW
ncbi:MAG: CARDB domain-containing protein [Dehalococcoidia bacterium]|nr:CARDB domain-containing protein [Dehalococcoidia bacterium]MDD5494356.1 CARDB domain-containing protein [Dehalococcoidia bacterium]